MICSKYGLLEQPSLFDFIHEKIITLVPFSVAILAIARFADNYIWLVLYFAVIGSHMLHILLQRCPYCAYYQTESKWLSCLWWRWVPKLREKKDGRAPKYLGLYTPLAILTITFYPIYWLSFQWELLMIYVLSWAVLALSIFTAGCSRCIDFKCKNNQVPKEVREIYTLSQK